MTELATAHGKLDASASVLTPAAKRGPDGAARAADHEVAVAARGITKRFGNTLALDATTLDIRRGEFFSLLGPSGCGKTTLLRIIGGFETPTAGDLLIGGRSALADPPYRRRTNMIFQHMALFPHLTVAENIAFGLEMKKWKRPAIRKKVEQALELVRLPDYGNRRVEALSGGQRQRIAMARALVNEPEVLLLDEPLAALDLQLRLHMQVELRRLHRATGSTFVFVTHDQGEAMSMSDRIAVMSAGQILQIGTPEEIYERPGRRFVAEFIGHSNFLTGRIAESRRGVIVDGLCIPCRVPDGLVVGKEVAVALRYEKVELVARSPEPAGIGADKLSGSVMAKTYMGSAIRFEISMQDRLTMIADVANTGLGHQFATGDRVWLRWAPEAATVLVD
jgi:ABC-type Fe3+/spermidine/putrescine transport system ATPase subunit